MVSPIRNRTAVADWAELGVDPGEPARRAHAAYVQSLVNQWHHERSFIACAARHPRHRDVTCSLERDHRSEEHWHPALWPRTAPLIWFDEPAARDLIAEPEPGGF